MTKQANYTQVNKYLFNISLQTAVDDIFSQKYIATERNRHLRNLFIHKFGITRTISNKLIRQVVWLHHRTIK